MTASRFAGWLGGIMMAATLVACSGGGDKAEGDIGPRWWLDVEEETLPAGPDADVLAPPDESAPPDEKQVPDELGEPCIADCAGKECGDDDGCGKACIVDTGCKGNPPCALGVCDQSGVCAFQPQDGECDDGNPCTEGDFCSQGKCKAGPDPLDCSDDNPCTTDGCTPEGGCYNESNTLPCDDLDPCTKGDACADGICVPGGPNLCDDKNVCTQDFCESASGCHNDPVLDGSSCDDNNQCTGFDQCTAGKCNPGKAISCDDGKPCTVDSCNPATGCAHANAADSTPCNDGDACTQADYCLAGKCVPSGEKDCNDFNGCTVDSCGAGGVCVNEKLTGDYYCSDDDPCTEPDWCFEGACQPGPLLPGCK